MLRLSSRTIVTLLGLLVSYCGKSENVFCGKGYEGCAGASEDSTEKTLIFWGFPRSSTTKSSLVKFATVPSLLRTMTPTCTSRVDTLTVGGCGTFCAETVIAANPKAGNASANEMRATKKYYTEWGLGCHP